MKYLSGNGKPDIDVEALLEKGEDREDGYDDLVNLPTLNDAELLINLKKRFIKKHIYTYVGPTLLALNPYEYTELTTAKTMAIY